MTYKEGNNSAERKREGEISKPVLVYVRLFLPFSSETQFSIKITLVQNCYLGLVKSEAVPLHC